MVVGGGLIDSVNAAEDELPDITTSSLEDGK